MRGQGDEWDQNACCEIYRESVNIKTNKTKSLALIYSYLPHIFLKIMQIAYGHLRGMRGRTPSLMSKSYLLLRFDNMCVHCSQLTVRLPSVYLVDNFLANR